MKKINILGSEIVKEELISKCQYCGEPIYKVTLANGETYPTERCQCLEDIRTWESLEVAANDKESTIAYNKERCGFTKRDLKEIDVPAKTHFGNIEAYNAIVKYANGFNENYTKGMYLYGAPGVGKSFLAKKAVKIVIHRGYSCYITTMSKLVNDLKNEVSSFTGNTKRKCIDVDLLILDEFGSEPNKEFARKEISGIISSRYENMKPIIYTSNLSLEKLKKKYDEFGQVYSRIADSTVKIEITGIDMRGL